MTIRYSPEVRERAVQMALEHKAQHRLSWATIPSIAPSTGCTGQRLSGRMKYEERDTGRQLGSATEIEARLPVQALIAFIDDHRGAHGVAPICKVLPIGPSIYRAPAARRSDPVKGMDRTGRDVAPMP
jgi:putative transposase